MQPSALFRNEDGVIVFLKSIDNITVETIKNPFNDFRDGTALCFEDEDSCDEFSIIVPEANAITILERLASTGYLNVLEHGVAFDSSELYFQRPDGEFGSFEKEIAIDEWNVYIRDHAYLYRMYGVDFALSD